VPQKWAQTHSHHQTHFYHVFSHFLRDPSGDLIFHHFYRDLIRDLHFHRDPPTILQKPKTPGAPKLIFIFMTQKLILHWISLGISFFIIFIVTTSISSFLSSSSLGSNSFSTGFALKMGSKGLGLGSNLC